MNKDKWYYPPNDIPPVDQDDKWNSEHNISKEVLVYHENYGYSFGRYYHEGNFWRVDKYLSSKGVKVYCWQFLPEIKNR